MPVTRVSPVRASGSRPRRLLSGSLAVLLLTVAGCEAFAPEVVVTNGLPDPFQIAEVSFGGCLWPAPLGPSETTSVCRALPGSDHVRFLVLNPCSDRCDVMGAPEPDYPGFVREGPLWYPYRTKSTRDARPGGFLQLSVTLDDIEQDFSAPSPYGH